MDYKTLHFDMRGHVGWLTLNRPEQHNALSWDMMLELRDFFGSLDDNLDVRVVVVRGAGGDFCVGLDLKSTPGFGGGWGTDAAVPGRFPPRGFMFLRKIFDIPIRMRQAPQPIICAVRGNAIGGGFGIAMASDIRLASETAKFNVGAPRLGLSAGDFAQSYFLPRLIGMSRAALYMFTSRFIDAATAERIGLVSQVVPDDQLDDATEELAQELLRISPFSLRMTKEVFNANIEVGNLLDATKLENRTQILCAYTDDSMEAIKATFVEKREPVYRDEG
jgi:enoyl-CoA hydratase/carnithine racemase